MGICGSRSLTAEERAAADKSKKIDQANEKDFQQEDGQLNIVICLLFLPLFFPSMLLISFCYLRI